jgi:hypothetical protein
MPALVVAGAAAVIALPAAAPAQEAEPDTAPPKVVSAKLVGKTEATRAERHKGRRAPVWSIRLQADDRASGVAFVQVASDLGNPPPFQQLPGVFRQYKDIWRVRRFTPPRWVRVSDAAGNVSAWNHIVGSRPPKVYAKATPVSFRGLLRNGLRVTAGCDEACTIAASLVLDSATARSLHLNRRIARRNGYRTHEGRNVMRLRLTASARSRLPRARIKRLTLVVRVRDLSRASATRRVTLVAH